MAAPKWDRVDSLPVERRAKSSERKNLIAAQRKLGPSGGGARSWRPPSGSVERHSLSRSLALFAVSLARDLIQFRSDSIGSDLIRSAICSPSVCTTRGITLRAPRRPTERAAGRTSMISAFTLIDCSNEPARDDDKGQPNHYTRPETRLMNEYRHGQTNQVEPQRRRRQQLIWDQKVPLIIEVSEKAATSLCRSRFARSFARSAQPDWRFLSRTDSVCSSAVGCARPNHGAAQASERADL